MDKLVFECVKYSLSQTDNVIKDYNLKTQFINEYVYNEADPDHKEIDKKGLKALRKELNNNFTKSFVNKVLKTVKGLGKNISKIFFKFMRLSVLIIISGQIYLTVIGVSDLNKKEPVFKHLNRELEKALKAKDIEEIKVLIRRIEEEINSGPEQTKQVLSKLIKDVKTRRIVSSKLKELALEGIEVDFLAPEAFTKLIHFAFKSLTGSEFNIHVSVATAEKKLKSIEEENLKESITNYTREKLKTILL